MIGEVIDPLAASIVFVSPAWGWLLPVIRWLFQNAATLGHGWF
jgi:hypothetical protein